MTMNFQNTIDLLGDEVSARMIADRTIEEFNDDTVDLIGRYSLRDCYALTSVNVPFATEIGAEAFYNCYSLTNVIAPRVKSFGDSAFNTCSELTFIDTSVEKTSTQCFWECKKLKTIAIRSNTVCTLLTQSSFHNTLFYENKTGGTLLVPRALVEEYKIATNWSVYWGYGHNRFLALEDYTVDGTITGEIDWDKLNGGPT